jgi:hypothetical protein
LCWGSCWARCWILQDMDHMQASCVLYVKVSRIEQLEQTKISIFTITLLEMFMLTVHHDLNVSVWFMYDPGDVFRQRSQGILSVAKCPFYIHQTCHFSCCSPRCIPVNTQTTSHWLTVNCWTIGILCS